MCLYYILSKNLERRVTTVMSFSCPLFIEKEQDTFFFFRPKVANCGLCLRWNCSSCDKQDELLTLRSQQVEETTSTKSGNRSNSISTGRSNSG